MEGSFGFLFCYVVCYFVDVCFIEGDYVVRDLYRYFWNSMNVLVIILLLFRIEIVFLIVSYLSLSNFGRILWFRILMFVLMY